MPALGSKLYRVEALRVGHWDYDGLDGGLNVTPELLIELVEHFNDGSKGYEVPVDGPSRGGEAHSDSDLHDCGWVKSLELAPDGQSIWATFEVTNSDVTELLDEGSLKYCSSELDLAWLDPEDKTTKRVFEGLSLCNRPYIKRMSSVQPLNFSEFAAAGGNDKSGDPGQPTPAQETKTMEPEVILKEKDAEIERLKAQLAEKTSSAGDQATVQLREQLKDEQEARTRLEEKLGETTRAMRLNAVRTRLTTLARKGKVTLPIFKKIVSLTEILLDGGTIDGTVVKLAAKRKMDEDSEPTDKLDVVDAVLDILDDIPAAISTDTEDLELEEGDDEGVDDDDARDKAACREMEKNPKLTYRQALQLVEQKSKGGAR